MLHQSLLVRNDDEQKINYDWPYSGTLPWQYST